MIELLMNGGPIFTFPMTLILFINLILMARGFIKAGSLSEFQMDTIKYIGVFLITVGFLGQIIGLYSAFQAIESQQIDISPAVMAGGLKISSITTLLGVIYFIISWIGWYAVRTINIKKGSR